MRVDVSTPTKGGRRWDLDWGLAAAGAALMVWSAQAFHPTQPAATQVLRACFSAVALYSAARFIGWGWRTHRASRLVSWLVGLALVWGLIQTMGTTLSVTHMWWPSGARALVSLEIGVIVGAVISARRLSRPRLLPRILGSVAFLNAFGFIPLCAYLWQPPASIECEGAAATQGVVRLSSQALADNLSYPYEVLYIPEEDAVAASFKMAGNTVLSFWDVEEANKVLVFGTARPEAVTTAVVDLHGQALPEHLVYHPERREVVVNRVGYSDNTIDYIPLATFPELSLRHSSPIHFPPHGLVLMPNGKDLGVFSADFRFAQIEPERGDIIAERQVERGGPNAVVTNLTHIKGSSSVYLSTFGQQLGIFDLDGGETVHVTVPFAGGDLVQSAADRQIYQTDMMFGALNVIDTRSDKLITRVDLGYQPRPIAVDAKRDLLMIGSWFTGYVYLYRRSTLEQLGEPIFVGTYLRKFAYDPGRALLYSGSRCGVYQLDLKTLWPEWVSG